MFICSRKVFANVRILQEKCWILAVILLSAGCGGGSTDVTGTVSGKVTLEGKSVPVGTSVICQHIERSFPAVGKTAADGSFKLSMKDSNNVIAGDYEVMLQSPVVTMDPAEAMRLSQSGKFPKQEETVPSKYRSFTTSGLKMTVKRGANTYDIDMKP